MQISFNTVRDALRVLDETSNVAIVRVPDEDSSKSSTIYEGAIKDVPYFVTNLSLDGLNGTKLQAIYPVDCETIGIVVRS